MAESIYENWATKLGYFVEVKEPKAVSNVIPTWGKVYKEMLEFSRSLIERELKAAHRTLAASRSWILAEKLRT